MSMSPISHVPLFAALPESEISHLEATLPRVRYPAPTILFREGDRGDHFYIVLDGEIAIVKAMGTDDERLVAVRCAGEFVGEMSLFNRNGLRTATVLVRKDAEVLQMSRADFDALLHRYPLLAYEMLRVMSTRLGDSHNAAIRDLHDRNERLAQAYADLQAAQAQIIEQKTLERELRLAQEIQESMLPRRLPALSSTEVGARMVPARMVGGDFFDVIQLTPDTIGIVIGDVSGKGVPAALFMALSCSLLRSEAVRESEPDAVLRSVNRQLFAMNAKGMFVTVLYGILEQSSGVFHYARAGHELPLIWDRNGAIRALPSGRGLPLALFPEAVLDTQAVELSSGSTVLLYTDGATDAVDPLGEQFGLERLQETVHAQLELPAQALCDALVATFEAYQHGHAPADDVTVVVARTF